MTLKDLFLGTQARPLLGLYGGGEGGGRGEWQPRQRAPRQPPQALSGKPPPEPSLAKAEEAPSPAPFPLNWSQAVLTHYSLAGRPWPRAKANKASSLPGGWLALAWAGREAPTPGPCCGQPACVPQQAQPQPGPGVRLWAPPSPPGLGLAVPLELVLLRALLPPVSGSSFSAKGDADSYLHGQRGGFTQGLPLTRPWDSRGGISQDVYPS